MKSLTKRQREILDYILNFEEQNRFRPSYRQIMSHFQFTSKGTVYKHMQSIAKKGFLSQGHIQETTPPESDLEVPFMGILSGRSGCSLFSTPQTIAIPKALVASTDGVYAMRISGDAFHHEMIRDGDLILIKAHQEISEGESVLIAYKEGNFDIRKFYPEGAYIRLGSLDPDQDPLIVRSDQVRIQGALIGLLRIN